MKIRALLVDDESHRANCIAGILPPEVEYVWVPNAKLAKDLLSQEKFPILMLDHDLYHDSGNGQDVARAVAETQDASRCFVFIHSQNSGGAQAMLDILNRFVVTVAPWENGIGTAKGYKDWLAFSAKLIKGSLTEKE